MYFLDPILLYIWNKFFDLVEAVMKLLGAGEFACHLEF